MVAPLADAVQIAFSFSAVIVEDHDEGRTRALCKFFRVGRYLVIGPVNYLSGAPAPGAGPVVLVFHERAVVIRLFVSAVYGVINICLLHLIDNVPVQAYPYAFECAVGPGLVDTPVLPLAGVWRAPLVIGVIEELLTKRLGCFYVIRCGDMIDCHRGSWIVAEYVNDWVDTVFGISDLFIALRIVGLSDIVNGSGRMFLLFVPIGRVGGEFTSFDGIRTYRYL